jgi:hypothetical protein
MSTLWAVNSASKSPPRPQQNTNARTMNKYIRDFFGLSAAWCYLCVDEQEASCDEATTDSSSSKVRSLSTDESDN